MGVSKKVRSFMEQGSWIRRMFEEGIALKQQFGEDNVFDLSLGNPVVNRIQATAEKQGVDLGEAWKARASLELVGTWAENKTTLPAELLDTAEKLFRSIKKAFYGPEESPRRSTR